ncbi:MAG: RNA polymerase sigma factor [Planctomycetota bacterium]|jgi:RNA polymerase sigma-70 factor (ECF subfamily)
MTDGSSDSGRRPAHELTDEELMVRFQDGDRLAYRLLVERYSREITAFTARLLGDRIWAEDLTQDVFLKLYQKGHTFRAESKLSTWLYRVARNACYDFLKRRKHEPRLLPTGGQDADGPRRATLPEPDAGQPGPARRLEQAEVKQQVMAALDALPKRFRDPFVLVVLQGLSYDAAAEIAGCSVKTLSSRLSRARNRFRVAMAPYLAQGEDGTAPPGPLPTALRKAADE